jgi:YHS domain-containing protein
MRKSMVRKSIALLFALLLLSVSAFAQDNAKPAGKLTRVETKMVCMINEHAMGKEQIPIEIEGRTYYGCCDMCKKALAADATKRVATDPVSGKQVDKATAVIAAQEDGRVFYFENEASLAKYNKQFEK